jgi:hypothetical protein
VKNTTEELVAYFGVDRYNELTDKVEAPTKKYKVHMVVGDALTTMDINAHYSKYTDGYITFHTYTGELRTEGRWEEEYCLNDIFYTFDRDKVICVEMEKG